MGAQSQHNHLERGSTMSLYITLWRYTRDGMIDIKNTPERFDAVKEIYKINGGKLIQAYSLIGSYDVITIGELPDEKALTKAILQICSKGRVTAHSMTALPIEDFLDIIRA
jgi:uncharacterized protein with GYD domain